MGSQPFVVLSAIKLHLIKKNTEAGNQMKIHAVMSINFLQKVSWFYQVDKNTSPSNVLFWRCNKTEPGFTSSHRQLYPLTAQCGWWVPAWISWFSPCWTQYLQAPNSPTPAQEARYFWTRSSTLWAPLQSGECTGKAPSTRIPVTTSKQVQVFSSTSSQSKISNRLLDKEQWTELYRTDINLIS